MCTVLSNMNLPSTLGGNQGSAPILLFFLSTILGLSFSWFSEALIFEFFLKTALSTDTYKLPKYKSTISQSFWKIVFSLLFYSRIKKVIPDFFNDPLITQEHNVHIPCVYNFYNFIYYCFLVLSYYKTQRNHFD